MTVRGIYTIRRSGPGYRVIKCDGDFNSIAYYAITPSGKQFECSCPARAYPCRHLKMLLTFHDAKAIDKAKFYDYATSTWVRRIRQ